jgi:hypothetical protein
VFALVVEKSVLTCKTLIVLKTMKRLKKSTRKAARGIGD